MAYPRRQSTFFLPSDEQQPARRRSMSTDESSSSQIPAPVGVVGRSSPRPPPSSFAFPFQAYPGNPDPGMRVPGQPRRYSLESLNELEQRRRSSASLNDLPPPNAPFMHTSGGGSGASSPATGSSDTLPRSPSSSSLYKSSAAAAAIPRTTSTHSFRAPFLAPPSRPSSTVWTPPPNDSSSGFGLPLQKSLKMPAPSTRLAVPLTEEDKPWLRKRAPYTYRSYFTTLFFIFLGAAGSAALCYFGYTSVPLIDSSRLCLVLDEDFSSGSLDEGTWNREVQLGGFGNGEFQMATADSDNLFIRNNQLYIHPTLTSDKVSNILDGGNYTLDGCTEAETNSTACSVASSALLGRVINPVMSARINTKSKKYIKYGKVEVRAKTPRGDWLWPAIWMLPEDEGVQAYGAWPMSGEIDILEARGNGPSYPAQGSNYVRSSVNYGPLPALYRQIFGWQSTKQTSFDKGFHTYTLEWTERFIRMYVDKRTTAMLQIDHLDTKGGKRGTTGGFWNRGAFPKTVQNGSSEVVVENIWEKAGGGYNAPFDKRECCPPIFLAVVGEW